MCLLDDLPFIDNGFVESAPEAISDLSLRARLECVSMDDV